MRGLRLRTKPTWGDYREYGNLFVKPRSRRRLARCGRVAYLVLPRTSRTYYPTRVPAVLAKEEL